MAEHPTCAKSASQTKITILFEETYVSDENALTKVRLTQRFRCQYNVPTPAARGATVHSGKRARHTDEWAAYLPWCGPGPQLERAGLVWAAGGVGLRAHAPPKETSAISATAVTLKNQLLPLGFLLRSQRKFDFLATYAHIFLFFSLPAPKRKLSVWMGGTGGNQRKLEKTPPPLIVHLVFVFHFGIKRHLLAAPINSKRSPFFRFSEMQNHTHGFFFQGKSVLLTKLGGEGENEGKIIFF